MWVWINGPDVSDGAYQDFQNHLHLHAAETGGGAALEPSPPPTLEACCPQRSNLSWGVTTTLEQCEGHGSSLVDPGGAAVCGTCTALSQRLVPSPPPPSL